MRGSDSDHDQSDRSDDLSSREGSAEQDASDISDKMTLNDDANIVKKPISEDFVNNNKENDQDAKKWIMNPLRVSGNLFQDRRLSDEHSAKESEDKTSQWIKALEKAIASAGRSGRIRNQEPQMERKQSRVSTTSTVASG